MKKTSLFLCLLLMATLGSSTLPDSTVSPLPLNPPQKTLSERDIRRIHYIANVIYAESGGQCLKAKKLVATVIWQRAKRDPSKIHSVVKMSNQFANPQKDDVNEWQECLKISEELHSGKFAPVPIKVVNNSEIYPDHFYSGKEVPFWARGKKSVNVDGLRFLYLGKHRTS